MLQIAAVILTISDILSWSDTPEHPHTSCQIVFAFRSFVPGIWSKSVILNDYSCRDNNFQWWWSSWSPIFLWSLINSTDAVKLKQWCPTIWPAISLMGAFWASPRWDHPCTCHSHMSVGRTGASRAICHMWAPVGSKWHHRGQMGGPGIIRTVMLDRGCRDADLLCWHPSEGWAHEGRWRDGDIRRHGEGADKVTTTLVCTGPSQLWTIANLQQALITMQRTNS